MTTVAAQRLSQALTKAKGVGAVEDEVTIMGCPLVLQTLRPQDYEDILAQIEELDDVAYYNAYQIEHVARALIEIDGQDLRDVEYIEDEAPAGHLVWATLPTEELAQQLLKHVKDAGGDAAISVDDTKRTVKYERYDWVKRNVVSAWGREALVVVWQKFAELLVTADEKAKEGIEFRMPDESEEDKLRRLLGEISETFEGLPTELIDHVLKDSGLQRSTTVDEMRKATERIDMLAKEEAPAPAPAPVAPAASAPAPAPAAPAPAAPAPAPVASPTAEELMRNRMPLNRRAVQPPIPANQDPQPAQTRAAVPEQLRQAAMQNTAGMSKRTASIAKLEAAADPGGVVTEDLQQPPMVAPENVAVLEKKAAVLQPGEAAKIIEQPPVAGINPRYKPQPR
jgi:hypothetical protein